MKLHRISLEYYNIFYWKNITILIPIQNKTGFISSFSGLRACVKDFQLVPLHLHFVFVFPNQGFSDLFTKKEFLLKNIFSFGKFSFNKRQFMREKNSFFCGIIILIIVHTHLHVCWFFFYNEGTKFMSIFTEAWICVIYALMYLFSHHLGFV